MIKILRDGANKILAFFYDNPKWVNTHCGKIIRIPAYTLMGLLVIILCAGYFIYKIIEAFLSFIFGNWDK